MRSAVRLFLLLLAGSLLVPAVASANSTGKFSRTGAPGESTCAACHSAAAVDNPGVLAIQVPAGYVPGQTYEIVVTLVGAETKNGSTPQRWGLGLSAIDATTETGAGSFVAQGPEVQTTITGGRPQATHTFCAAGSCPLVNSGGADVPGWIIDWVAPDEDVGSVEFYVVANAVNNNFSKSGDAVFATSAAVAPAAGVPSLSPPSLLALAGLLCASALGPLVFRRRRCA